MSDRAEQGFWHVIVSAGKDDTVGVDKTRDWVARARVKVFLAFSAVRPSSIQLSDTWP